MDPARREVNTSIRSFLRSPRAHQLLVGALMVLGGVLRIWGLTFGLPFTGAHPDETKFVSTALRFGYGDLNPHFFGYPSLFFYLTSAAFVALYAGGHFLGSFPSLLALKWQFFTDPSSFYIAARLLSAGLGTLTVLFTYRLGAALAGRPAGLVSALLVATNPLHVRNSHFATSDVPMAAFVTLALFHAVRAAQRGATRDFIRAGICYGLAASTKYPAVLFLPTLLGAALWPVRNDTPVPARLGRLGLGLFGAAIVMILTSPFLFLDWPAALRDLRYLAAIRETGWFGDSGESAWRYHLGFSLYYGLGLPFLPVLAVSMARMVKRKDRIALLVSVGGVAYFVFMGVGRLAFSRYMVPIIPLLCVLAGTLTAWPKLREMARYWAGRIVLICTLASILALPLYRVIRQDLLFARTDTRVLARNWILANIPSGANVVRIGSPFEFPRLQLPLSRASWESMIRAAEIDGGGQTGWRAARQMLAIPGFPPLPNYTLTDARRLSDVVREPGLPLYVATQEHTLDNFAHVHPDDRKTLEMNATLLWEIIPEQRAAPVYEMQDGVFLPFARFEGVKRPGPTVQIYRLP